MNEASVIDLMGWSEDERRVWRECERAHIFFAETCELLDCLLDAGLGIVLALIEQMRKGTWQ